jgi:hypothetical protein
MGARARTRIDLKTMILSLKPLPVCPVRQPVTARHGVRWEAKRDTALDYAFGATSNSTMSLATCHLSLSI